MSSGVGRLEEALRSSGPLLIVTSPITYNIALALSLLTYRLYLGLESHLTYSPTSIDARVSKLASAYPYTIVVGLESKPSGRNVILIDHFNKDSDIDPLSLRIFISWPRLPKILYLIHIFGLSIDNYALNARSTFSDLASYGLIKLDKRPPMLSLNQDASRSIELSLWPMIPSTNVKASTMQDLLASLSELLLSENFLGSYLDYVLVNTPYFNSINLALAYLGLEASVRNGVVRGDNALVPLVDLKRINMVVRGAVQADELAQYVGEVRDKVKSLISAARNHRLIEHRLNPPNMVIMHRLCQILSFHEARGSIRILLNFGGLQLTCIPSPSVQLGEQPLSMVKTGRYAYIISK